MGLFDWLGGYRAKLSGRDGESTVAESAAWWNRPGGIRPTQDTVLSLAAAWACVRLRSRVVGSLPISVFSKGSAAGRQEEQDHWLYRLLHDSPNADQTPYEFWSNVVASLDLWGNSYAEKDFNVLGQTTALTPWAPDRVTVARNSAGLRVYRYWDRGKNETLPADKVLHIRSLTLAGDVGLSAIAAGALSLGGALGADRTAAALLGDGLQISGFMETGQNKITPEQRADLVAIFAAFMGSANAGKIMPLERDFKFAPLTMNPAEARLLESRQFNIEEICRWFETPPILIGHAATGQTMFGSGVEQTFLGWKVTGLNPLLTNIEQAARKQLLAPAERALIKPEFNREGLMAPDSAGRAALYASAGQNGWMDRNEIRSKENLPARPGGDKLTVQSNLVPLETLGQTPARPVQPAPGEPMEPIRQ